MQYLCNYPYFPIKPAPAYPEAVCSLVAFEATLLKLSVPIIQPILIHLSFPPFHRMNCIV